MRQSFVDYYMSLLDVVKLKSKDDSTKVGAIIVKDNSIISTGYNGFPVGVNDDIHERKQRPEKYLWTEHAERNAIFFAAKNGISTNNCIMFSSMFPCADCARAIIQSGIKQIFTIKPNIERWNESQAVSSKMFEESDIKVVEY